MNIHLFRKEEPRRAKYLQEATSRFDVVGDSRVGGGERGGCDGDGWMDVMERERRCIVGYGCDKTKDNKTSNVQKRVPRSPDSENKRNKNGPFATGKMVGKASERPIYE